MGDKKPIPGFWATIEGHLRGMAAVLGAIVAFLGAAYGLWTWISNHIEAKRNEQAAAAQAVTPSTPVINPAASVINSGTPASSGSDHVHVMTSAEAASEAAAQAAEAVSDAVAAATEAAASASVAAGLAGSDSKWWKQKRAAH